MISPKLRLGLAFVGGALSVVSQAPLSVPYVLILTLPALVWLWGTSATSRAAFGVGWLAGAGYFGFGLFWIAEAFLVDAATFGWMIPFVLLAMSFGMGLFWAVGFWFAKWLGGRWMLPMLALPCAWFGVEMLRGYILTGFPWGLLGYAWVETPVMQAASVVGAYGVTFLTLLAASLLAAPVLHRGISVRVVAPALSVGVFAALWFWGDLRLSAPLAPRAEPLMVGIVQPNVPQREKWVPERAEGQLRDLLSITRQLTQAGAEVVLWPEAAVPYLLDQTPVVQRAVADALGAGRAVISGAQRIERRDTGRDVFNSLIAIGARGDVLGVYDKQHLVPFGEYVPFGAFLERFGILSIVGLPGGFSAGAEAGRTVALPGVPIFAAMICYEAIFPSEIIGPDDPRPDWMVHLTNDAWFGQSAGPYQHLAQVRSRAIEYGLPVARSANTGISAIIDPYGRIIVSSKLNTQAALRAQLPSALPATTFSKYRDLIPLMMLIVCSLVAVMTQVFRRKR